MSLVSAQVGGLWRALATVPDRRRSTGKRCPLASLLLIAVAALLSGQRDQLGIVRWGRRLIPEALETIGIDRNRIPARSVWCELFQGLNIVALEWVLGSWVPDEQSAGHVAITLIVAQLCAISWRKSPMAIPSIASANSCPGR